MILRRVSRRSGRRFVLVVAFAASASCVSAPAQDVSSPGAGHSSGRRPIIYGYPYASRCPAAGRAEVVDRWGMYMCNCTSYVAWALEANGQRIDWFIRGAMNAWNWPRVARLRGLRVRRRPSAGAVVVWPKLGPPLGHVAYVTRIDPDGRFDVSEYNLPSAAASSRFGFDTRANLSARGAAFIDVPPRRERPHKNVQALVSLGR